MNRQEIELDRYNAFLKSRENELAPSFGATALLAVAALGVVDSPRPRMEYSEKPISNVYAREMGTTALATLISDVNPIEITPQTTLGYSEFSAAA
jgi:hypothetical protein